MTEKLKNIIKDITPPMILRGAKKLIRAKVEHDIYQEDPGEKTPEWYDRTFEADDHWRSHYTQSPYYFLWTVIVDRIVKAEVDSILEMACGSGQLACLMRDNGIRTYHGFDFSPVRVAQASKSCPEFTFTVEDAFRTELFTTYDYRAIVCTEFLEHVGADLEIISRIKSGTTFYGTVPNFPFVSHVRHFTGEDQVFSRYKPYFKNLHVDCFLANVDGKTFYLLEGQRV